VQHARPPGWSPDASLGQADGQEASANAKATGFPTGVSLWCDLEGVNTSARAQDVMDYAQAWYNAVNTASYSPGLYVGAGTLLSGQQLFDLPFRHYWRSSSRVPDIPKRGYQLLQFSPALQLNGIAIDLDVALPDQRGDSARWLRASAAPG
jgi:hypothetical protein